MTAGAHYEIACRYERHARHNRRAAAAAARREAGRIIGALRKAPVCRVEKAVARRLAGLWLYWRRRGWIEPTVAELAEWCKADRRAVQRTLRKMGAAGWVTWDPEHVGGRGVRRRMTVNVKRMLSDLIAMIGPARRAMRKGLDVPRGLGWWVQRVAVAKAGRYPPAVCRYRHEKGGTTRARLEIYSTPIACGGAVSPQRVGALPIRFGPPPSHLARPGGWATQWAEALRDAIRREAPA